MAMVDDKIRDQKLQYNINKEVAKISALSSGKIDKYEYLTGKEILSFDPRNLTCHLEGTGIVVFCLRCAA